ncbi:MAG: hypothetical protein DMF64_08680 [Acidobacteria bacterium]|nr:MAG: hypothetical protein DMF64_08680 [Acidobacteriota bacterium]
MVTCTPASGSFFSVGATTVTCANSAGPSCSFTINVVDDEPPTITSCATNKILTATSGCQAAIPDLTGEVAASDNCAFTIT